VAPAPPHQPAGSQVSGVLRRLAAVSASSRGRRIVATAQHPHGGEYTEIAGLQRLREAFASELSATYSAQVRPEHVIITAGLQSGFFISDAGMRLP
jgi:DNA-binding transcriptional MocR family regulator